MLKIDALSQLKQLKRDIKASRNLHVGHVKGTSNKFGFVTLESGKDIFLPADEMAKVLPGDKIEVEVKKEPKNKTFALIERLIESPTKEFFGKYMTKGNAHFVEADIPGLSQWIFIPPPKRKNAKSKDLVRCRITQHPLKTGKAQASVQEVIGAEQETGIEWKYALLKHGIQQDWSEEALAQLAEINEGSIETLVPGREDLSDLPFVTIDSASTQDMDDALWVEKQDNSWLVRIAIADPVALIPEGSPLDAEVIRRATAIYLPGMQVPMLPVAISSDLGSLQEGKKRLARIVEVALSFAGEISSRRVFNAVICSKRKFSYQQASEIVESGPENEDVLTPMLLELHALSEVLYNWRRDKALIHSGKQEFYLELNDKKKIANILPRERTLAHRIVEECMIVANRAVADILAGLEVNSLFVCHEGVRPDRREALISVLKKEAPECVVEDLGQLEQYVQCFKALSGLEDERRVLYTLATRQLARMNYREQAAPHFALGFDVYTTFTSPLRKANDYLVHRQIDRWLTTGVPEPVAPGLVAAIEQSGQSARNVAHDVEQWLKCQYMNTRSEVFKAQVVRVFASGCQIRLVENGIEGFVSTRDLEGKFSYNQDMMILSGPGREFRLDQEIAVKKKLVDWSRKQIMFSPVEAEPAPAEPDKTEQAL